MATASSTRTLGAAPQAVWKVIEDPYQMPRWWPGVTRMEGVQGDRFTQVFTTKKGRKWALRVAPVIDRLTKVPGLQTLIRGLVAIANAVTPGEGFKRGPFVTEAEIRSLAEVAAEESVIEEEEKE